MSRVMALDVGDRTVGVAVTDDTHTIAQGVTTVRRRSRAADVAALQALVDQYEVDRVVVGWPLRLDGRVGVQAMKVARFAELIEAELGLPVERFDERLTTVAAERALLEGDVSRKKRKQVVDQVAATLILQGWLEARAHGAAGR
mgnify:CR=1 FL=1